MKGVICNYKRGRKTYTGNQLILVIEGVNNRKEAEKLKGKKVIYNTEKKEIIGEIRAAHGNKGAVRVLFSRGMPGQALGKKVDVV